MRPCSDSSECREEDGYGCYSEDELNACVAFEPDPALGDLPILTILDQDRPEAVVRFCAVAPGGCPPER